MTAALDPGIAVGFVDALGENQRFSGVFLSTHDEGGDYWPRPESPTFAELDAVTASELLRDLTEVTAPPSAVAGLVCRVGGVVAGWTRVGHGGRRSRTGLRAL